MDDKASKRAESLSESKALGVESVGRAVLGYTTADQDYTTKQVQFHLKRFSRGCMVQNTAHSVMEGTESPNSERIFYYFALWNGNTFKMNEYLKLVHGLPCFEGGNSFLLFRTIKAERS